VLQDENGDIIIVDHKSKGQFNSKKEQHKYARQLYLYSIYIKNKYGKFPQKLIFNMFRKCKTVIIPFNDNDYQEAIKWMKDTVDAIEGCFEFEPKFNDYTCWNICNHRETCEYKVGD
jgi:hypothetical protein